MYQIGNKKKAFSLIEIIVSLAIFSFIITMVIGITISLIRAQTKIQAQLFLTQTAQISLETISRELRYGYSYSGGTMTGPDIFLDSSSTNTYEGESSTTFAKSAILSNMQNSKFILFESANGNTNTLLDQNAFCINGNKLFKITKFDPPTSGGSLYKATCNTDYGSSMLPSDITIDNLSFDIVAGDTKNPKNPTVRIKMKLSHPDGGSIELQTSVTQRLVSYF